MSDTPIERSERWSYVRQAEMSAFEARLYLERAGLEPAEAVTWWEQYVLSSEAAEAIANGWSIEETVKRRRSNLARDRAERARSRSEGSPEDPDTEAWNKVHDDVAAAAIIGTCGRDDTDDEPVFAGRTTYRLAHVGDRVVVSDVTDGRTVELAHCRDLSEALAHVSASAAERGREVRWIECRAIGPVDILMASDHLIPAVHRPDDVPIAWFDAAATTAGDGFDAVKLCGSATSQFLAPVSPEHWPGFVAHGSDVVSVGRLFMASGLHGYAPVGRFENAADGIAACRAARRSFPVASVTRESHTDSEPTMTVVTVVPTADGYALVGRDGRRRPLSGDMREAFRTTPELHRVTRSERTTIDLAEHIDLDPAELGALLLLVDDADPGDGVDERLPAGLAQTDLVINGERWTWTERDHAFVCFGDPTEPWLQLHERWAHFAGDDLGEGGPGSAGSSYLELGRIGRQVVWLEDLHSTGTDVRLLPVERHRDELDWIIEWLGECGPAALQLLAETCLAEGHRHHRYLESELVEDGSPMIHLSLGVDLVDLDKEQLAARLRCRGHEDVVDSVLEPTSPAGQARRGRFASGDRPAHGSGSDR